MVDKTILVTGGAGYVGSHACKALAQAGYVPVTYDNLFRGHRELVKWGPLEVGDICDPARLKDVIARHKPVATMHFAAMALVGESVSQPDVYHRVNVEGTSTLLAIMRGAGVDKIVVSGTCAVYGMPKTTPITEDTPIAPISPYGETKLGMERRVSAADVSSVVLRYFNAAGADPDAETGEWHEPETHLIPNVLNAATKGETLRLFGDDYPTPDGTCIRDYIHVCDIAAAHVAALAYMDKAPGAHVFNLGTGTGNSVREVIETARRVTGKDIRAVVEKRREGDPAVLVANSSRVQSALGWTPRRSLEDQVRDAWRWTQKNG